MVNIGIECGGTFTDMVVSDEDGGLLRTAKVLSTPANPAEAIRTLLDSLPSDWHVGANLYHGSTVATNALIERNGPRIALINSHGFGDVLFIQRQDRTRMFDLKYERPEHLVREEDSFEVTERIDSHGAVVTPLDEARVAEIAEEIVDRGIDDVAVCLLHAYADPEHEQRVKEILLERDPSLRVALSSQVSPEFREYERVSTTAVAAFLANRVSSYLSGLERIARETGIAHVEIMQSNGGRVPVASAIANPLGMLRSGPAAGVAGAIAAASQVGIDDFVTLDMGGTSTDVALVKALSVEETTEMSEDGIPVSIPMIDIVAVGAGGGSLAHLDSGGLLKVGPESAGANPGPAAYGRGGVRPTVTDANVVRGILRGSTALSDDLHLDVDAAAASFTGLADQLGMSRDEIAEQVTRLASSQMAGAIRVATVEKGSSLDGYSLIVYGGAGPMHAAEVADELHLTDVLIPPHNGLTSAYGLLASAFKRHFSRTAVITLADESWDEVVRAFRALRAEADDTLRGEGVALDELNHSTSIDMRYRGQGYELDVPIGPDIADAESCRAAFHEAHRAKYGYANLDGQVQAITLRLRVEGPNRMSHLPKLDLVPAEADTGTVLERGERVPCTYVLRSSLPTGFRAPGPLVIEDATSTTYVPTGWTVTVDPTSNLLLRK